MKDYIDMAYSPISNKYEDTQRLQLPKRKHKIIYGKRYIKPEIKSSLKFKNI